MSKETNIQMKSTGELVKEFCRQKKDVNQDLNQSLGCGHHDLTTMGGN